MAVIGAMGSPRDHCTRLDFDTGDGRTRPGTHKHGVLAQKSADSRPSERSPGLQARRSPMTPLLWSPRVQEAEAGKSEGIALCAWDLLTCSITLNTPLGAPSHKVRVPDNPGALESIRPRSRNKDARGREGITTRGFSTRVDDPQDLLELHPAGS